MKQLHSVRFMAGVLLLAGCQCGTKPIPDRLSSSFEMSRDSLPFANFVSGYEASALDSDGMQRMFGEQVCTSGSSPCQLTSAAQTFMDQANASMSGGRCEGFAVLSDLMAAKKIDVATFGAATARELTLEENPALQREIAYWFATQLVPGAVASKTKTYTAKDVLGVLADSLEEGATEHYRIGIVRKLGKSISGGHSLTPIGFYKDPKAKGVYWLRVYDNNHPDVERLMKIDTANNRWEFEAATDPAGPSRLYFGDSSNNNPLYLAPVFSRQGVLPCPFCEGGGSQIVTSGGAQATVETPGGNVGVSEGELTAAEGTSITPSFSDPNDAEGASFIIGLTNKTLTGMGNEIVIRLTAPPDPQNPDAFQGVGVLRNNVFTLARGLTVTGTDTFTASNLGGTYTNASRTPIELTTKITTSMGEVTVTAYVVGGSDAVTATVDPATGQLKVDLTGAMGTTVSVRVEGKTSTGETKVAQFTFSGTATVSLQADTTGWMQGGLLSGTLLKDGVSVTITNACTDGKKSGLETDVDCGAVCNVGCGLGKRCEVDGDCASGTCHPTQKVCLADACNDTRQSPGETGVDCGGPCAPCGVGLGCSVSRDCANLALNDCVGGTCQRVFTIGAAVSFPPGIGGGTGVELVLANGSDQLAVDASGSYVFNSRTTGPYAVSIVRQPVQASCAIASPSGTATGDVFVTVTCTRRFTIGGFVSGLPSGESVTLSNNGLSPLTVSQDGAFVFPVQPAGSYLVTVTTQPTSTTCAVTRGAGAAPTADVTDVLVECGVPTYTIGGTLSGLGNGKSLVLTNNGAPLPLSVNGAFTFTAPVTGAYDVQVAVPPMGQSCMVTNGTGTATMNVTNVTVACTTPFTIGGALLGLGSGKTIVLDNNGDQLTLNADGPFVFTNGVTGMYGVTVATQPVGQMCTVQNGGGTATANVVDVLVFCPGAPGKDPTFGTNGVLRVAQTADGDAWQALVINPDSSIVLAGFAEPTPGSTQWIISKVTPAGAIDATFGLGGHRVVTNGMGSEQANAIVRDATGRYLVAGALEGTSDLDAAVVRLTSAGALDMTFGTGGVAMFDFGGDEVLNGLALDSMGRIVAVGRQGQAASDPLVLRLTSAGALDMTFATSGKYLPTTAAMDELSAVVLDASDNVIAVGGSDLDSLLIKLTSAGAPDGTFGTSGVVTLDLTTGLYPDHLSAAALDGTRIVAAGAGMDSAASNFYLAGFTSAGALDTAFGAGGITAIGGAVPNESFNALAPRPGGGWYAAGELDTSGAVLRFNASGGQDLTFGTSGQFVDAFSGEALVFAVGIDPLGRIVVAGMFSTGMGAPGDLGIARINP